MTMKKHRARQGGHAETHLDTDDQKHLREVVLEELEAVMRKHKCGGVLFVNSFESAAWRYVLPEWGGLTDEGGVGIRVRINSKSPRAREVGDSTLGFIKSMRVFTAQSLKLFDALWAMVSEALGPENIYDVYGGYDMGADGKPKPPGSGDNN